MDQIEEGKINNILHLLMNFKKHCVIQSYYCVTSYSNLSYR